MEGDNKKNTRRRKIMLSINLQLGRRPNSGNIRRRKTKLSINMEVVRRQQLRENPETKYGASNKNRANVQAKFKNIRRRIKHYRIALQWMQQ